MMTFKKITAVCLGVMLSGCADLANQARIDWEHGARLGTVTRIIDADVKPGERPVCLAKLSTASLQERQYVEVRYRHRRHFFREAGALPAGVQARPGDVVEFYPKDCDAGIVSTVTRLLPSAVP